MNWLNQDWEHEIQHTEMYIYEAEKDLEKTLNNYNKKKKIPAKIKLLIHKKEKNEYKPKSL